MRSLEAFEFNLYFFIEFESRRFFNFIIKFNYAFDDAYSCLRIFLLGNERVKFDERFRILPDM